MRGLGVALQVELLAWRRSIVQRVATPLLTLLVPVASVGLVALARSGAVVSAGAAKLEPYSAGPAAAMQLMAAGQVLSVATLMAGGFAAAAMFAQPLADGRAGALFGLATPRGAIAVARCLVLLGWAAACAAVAVGVTVLCALVTEVLTAGPAWAGDPMEATLRALLAALLAAGLALPFAAMATATRSPLATVGALIAVVAVTQMVVLVGGGAWFPYAVPSLWTGTGGAEAAASVGPAGLLLTAAVAPVASAVVVQQWRRLTDV